MAGPFAPPARLKSLKNDYGSAHGPNAPTDWLIAILDGHPEQGGVELDDTSCPGYARLEATQADFVETVDGGMQATIGLPDATGPWTKTGVFAMAIDADDPDPETGGWDYVLIDQVTLSEAGPFENPLRFTVYYSDDSTTPPE